ncbi:ATP-dependent DNA ligase [Streptomyces sp. NPDC007088]|uniref:ATP-dependent DNA ligase n=1 Tax=Streptomyces sp. NPDC007088 TaxID=3364773 RepID=UPI0036C4FA29
MSAPKHRGGALPRGLRPPLRVALAESVSELPEGGRWAFEPKFDGHRMLVFRDAQDTQGAEEASGDPGGGGQVVLQARSGRLVTRAFPDLVAAALALPPGTVLDGEVVVWTDGHTDFAAVQRRAAATVARSAVLARALPASYAAFDVLAVGGEDVRSLPYERRRALLAETLAPLGPPLQAVPVTEDRATARHWYASLAGTGVEGLVAKRLDEAYRGGRRGWLKLRHRDTLDALVLGFVGGRARPRLLVLALPGDGSPVASTPLAPALRSRAAALLPPAEGGRGTVTAAGTGETAYERVAAGAVVEVRRETTRQGTVEVVRFRLPEGE